MKTTGKFPNGVRANAQMTGLSVSIGKGFQTSPTPANTSG